MTSAIELSVRFGLPISKMEAICDALGVELRDEDFAVDKQFEFIARTVKRKRVSSYTLAWAHAEATETQRDFLFDIDPDFHDEYLALKLPIMDSERLDDAAHLIKKLMLGGIDDKLAWGTFATWTRARIGMAGEPVGHGYLAVRLLLSVPRKDMRDYPGTITTALNRLRHHHYLDGWHSTVQHDGKNVVMYHKPDAIAPAEPLIQIDLTNSEVEKFAARLGTDDPAALASFIAYEKKLDIKKVSAFLKQNWFDL